MSRQTLMDSFPTRRILFSRTVTMNCNLEPMALDAWKQLVLGSGGYRI
jgi:hypothetical protein